MSKRMSLNVTSMHLIVITAAPTLPAGNISNWLAITLSVLQTSICDNSMANKTNNLIMCGNFIVFVKTSVVANICTQLMFTKNGLGVKDNMLSTRNFTGVQIMDYHIKRMNGELL